MDNCSKTHSEVIDNNLKEKEIDEKSNDHNEKFKFEDFTSKDDVIIEGALKDAFDYAFDLDNIKIKNIGLLGKYSSGKSSLINSYLKTRNIEYIRISFAHFRKFEEDEKDIYDMNSNSIILEKKIINQLVNLIDDKKIKRTEFNIKRKISPFEFICTVIYIILVIISLNLNKFDRLFSEFLNCENNKNILGYSLIEIIKQSIIKFKILLYISVFVFTIIFLIYYIHKFKIMIIDGYKVKINKLELESKKDDTYFQSYFDIYLTEIIYLFENSKFNIILFEDIDRFEIKLIFQRLHEINGVINQRLKKKINV